MYFASMRSLRKKMAKILREELEDDFLLVKMVLVEVPLLRARIRFILFAS